MKKPYLACALALPLVLLSALPASAATFIGNGDFESDPAGTTAITSWTAVNQLVDLGVTEIAGCVTQDTSDYSNLRDYADEAEPQYVDPIVGDEQQMLDPADNSEVWMDIDGNRVAAGTSGAYRVYFGTAIDKWGDEFTDYYVIDGSDIHNMWKTNLLTDTWELADGFESILNGMYYVVPDPTVRQDNNPPQSDTDFWYDQEFSVSVADANTLRADNDEVQLTSNALELYSTMEADGDGDSGYVAHGPAAYSEAFTTTEAREVSLDWYASGDEDDYHVLGYVLNVDTCEQIEVLDSTGEESDWSTATVTLPTAGNYRFVFVSGTYDATWGTVAGALMYVDNIRITPIFAEPAVLLEPLFDVGAASSGAGIQLSGGGLTPNSAWTATIAGTGGTPVTLATGTTDIDGAFWQLGSLPAGLTAGKYAIILTGTTGAGPVTSTQWITVADDGTISYLSSTGPQPIEVEEPEVPVVVDPPVVVEPPVVVDPGVAQSAGETATAQAGSRESLASTGGSAPDGTLVGTAAALIASGAAAIAFVTWRRRRAS